MTAGETEDYGWQNFWADWELAACDFEDLLDFAIDTSPISSAYQLADFDSIIEVDSSILTSRINSRDRALRSTCWIDALCIDQLDYDMRGHYQSDTSNSTASGLNKERWKDFALQAASVAAPSCGLCVLGNLKASAKDRAPGRYSSRKTPGDSRNDNRSPQRTWSSCRSTRTLISRRSESLKGTGRWLLEHEGYTQWLIQPSSFLWLCGRPGAGKSVLMSTVIQDLEKNRRTGDLVAYYFANGYYRGVGTAKAILCSMLGQLLFREPIRTSFAQILPLLNDLIAAGNTLSTSRMTQLLSNIRHTLRSHETLYLLLDGLDEVTDSLQERELVLELIDHASRYDPNHQIKCFISSRSTFFGERLPKGALRVDLDSHPLTRNDMSLYVKDNLQKFLFEHPSRDIKELAERLLDSASGSFLVLRLILEASQAPPHGCATNKNFFVNLNDFGEIKLAKIYGAMLARIEDCKKEAALSMLQWVTFAARPLESHELLALYKQTGFEIKEEDISTISAGLLISSGNQIKFTHLSVREYFESQLSDRWEELSEEANEMIAHTCLRLLSPENLLQSLSLLTKNFPSSKDTIAPGFVPYAQTHWMFHYKRGERRSTYLAGLLHDILEQSLKISKKNGHGMEEEANKDLRENIEISPAAECRQYEFLNVVNIALRVGARFGFTKLAKLELDMGANFNIASGPELQTPLCLAAKGGHLEVVELLLQRGADLNIASVSGLGPMAYATANGHFEIQNLLMQYTSKSSPRRNCHEELGCSQNATQELWLTAVISPSCSSCTASMVQYELCAVPGIIDEGKVLPPILVSGETISESELGLCIDLLDKLPGIGKTSKLSTVVRWFPGVHMYRALNSISRRGIDDVRRWLIAAGNDSDSLDMVISVSKLLARSRF